MRGYPESEACGYPLTNTEKGTGCIPTGGIGVDFQELEASEVGREIEERLWLLGFVLRNRKIEFIRKILTVTRNALRLAACR